MFDLETEKLVFTEAVPVQIVCGCYMLLNDNKVVYIGQSKNILKRVAQHLNVKKFDSYRYIEVPEPDLDEAEADLIVKYNPPLNGALPRSSKYRSVQKWEPGINIKIKNGAQPVWGNYYKREDVTEIESWVSCWYKEGGCCECAKCGYGKTEEWRPSVQEGYCPKCNSKDKVYFTRKRR